MDFGGPTLSRSTFSGQKAQGLRDDFATISDEFGPPFGGHFGAILEPCRHLAGKSGNTDSPKGRFWEVHSNAIAQFSLFCPDPFWLHFGSHFGMDLEAQITIILLLCWCWSSVDRLLGFLLDVHGQQGSSRGLDTLGALSAGGGGSVWFLESQGESPPYSGARRHPPNTWSFLSEPEDLATPHSLSQFPITVSLNISLKCGSPNGQRMLRRH